MRPHRAHLGSSEGRRIISTYGSALAESFFVSGRLRAEITFTSTYPIERPSASVATPERRESVRGEGGVREKRESEIIKRSKNEISAS